MREYSLQLEKVMTKMSQSLFKEISGRHRRQPNERPRNFYQVKLQENLIENLIVCMGVINSQLGVEGILSADTKMQLINFVEGQLLP